MADIAHDFSGWAEEMERLGDKTRKVEDERFLNTRLLLGTLTLALHNVAFLIHKELEHQSPDVNPVLAQCKRTMVYMNQIMSHISTGDYSSLHEKVSAGAATATELAMVCTSEDVRHHPLIQSLVFDKYRLFELLDQVNNQPPQEATHG